MVQVCRCCLVTRKRCAGHPRKGFSVWCNNTMSDDGSRPGTAWTSHSTSVPPLRASGLFLATTAERPSSAAEPSSGAYLTEDTNAVADALRSDWPLDVMRSRPPHGSVSPPATLGGKKKLPPLADDGAAIGRLRYAPEWTPVPLTTASAAEGSSPRSPRMLAPLLGAPSSVAGPSDEAGRDARLLQAEGATCGPGRPRKGGLLRARLKQVQSQQAIEERQRAAAMQRAAKAD